MAARENTKNFGVGRKVREWGRSLNLVAPRGQKRGIRRCSLPGLLGCPLRVSSSLPLVTNSLGCLTWRWGPGNLLGEWSVWGGLALREIFYEVEAVNPLRGLQSLINQGFYCHTCA